MVEKIGLGTVQFGTHYGISNKTGQTSSEQVRRILRKALKLGIDLLDTASGYGTAEQVLGENDLSSFKIVSKFLPPSSGEPVMKQLDQSLNFLNKDALYAYLAHRPQNLLRNPHEWEELRSFKEMGKVNKIGYSLNYPDELGELLDAGMIPDLIQVPYNYFDRRFETYMTKLKSLGCEIHTRSTFLQGLFFMDPEDLDSFFDEVRGEIKNVQDHSSCMVSGLLNFSLEEPFVDKVILGIENENQLTQNIEDIQKDCRLHDLNKKIPNKILIPAHWPQKQ